MLRILAIVAICLAAVWAQQSCPNLQACLEQANSQCGDSAPGSGGRNREGRDRAGNRDMMRCINETLSKNPQFDANNFQRTRQPKEDRCNPRKAFEACGIESPEGKHRGSDGRGGDRQDRPDRAQRNNGTRDGAGRGGRRGGDRNGDAPGQEGKDFGRGRRGDHHDMHYLKGCREQMHGDRAPPTDGHGCRKQAMHECMKNNKPEIEAALGCTIQEREDKPCDPIVAAAIESCKN